MAHDNELEKVIGHVPQSKQMELRNLLLKYQEIFATNNNQPGTTNVVKHEIGTGNSQPISPAPYSSNPRNERRFIVKFRVCLKQDKSNDTLVPGHPISY